MKYDDVPKIMRDAYGAHQVFYRVGYSLSRVFLELRGDICSVLLDDGDKRFRIAIGKHDLAPKEFQKQWQEFHAAMKSKEITLDDREKMYREYLATIDSCEFLAAMLAKGFAIKKQLHSTAGLQN